MDSTGKNSIEDYIDLQGVSWVERYELYKSDKENKLNPESSRNEIRGPLSLIMAIIFFLLLIGLIGKVL